ncbi:MULTISPECIES: HNH endonuclease [Bacillus]|uniref:HNH endonuclease n=1 Tax=Bacillus TaxID=1386 RepID=UPI000BF41B94|nr:MULTISPECIES: HNH endonuclease [Bacillus]KAA1804759.1 hypothetical protein FXB61_004377 [Bacillus cereus]PFA44864.1 hypothetical protein CN381_14020 [Bacillus cereus]PKS13567.1 HNH endonuclease [Bacillus sp. BI3]
MNITIDLSEILLYLDLIKKNNRSPSIDELNMMVYYLDNAEQVKVFYNKIDEHGFKPPFVFYNRTLIHFIEDYEDCVELKNRILKTQIKRRRKYSVLFEHQILLCKSEEQAINIIKEAKDYGVSLEEDVWVTKFDSMLEVKAKQKAWKERIMSSSEYKHFPAMYQEFCSIKVAYFKSLSLERLKQISSKQQSQIENTCRTTQTSVFTRSVYVKEFARRVSKGICQLCDKEAPFLDKYGNPFLEVHHIHYLSKGGSDTIDNVVALCPNCHRKIHLLEMEEDIKKISEKATSHLNI